MGIRQMAITGEHGVGEAELRHVRSTFVTRENLRAAITTVVNATLEAREPQWWGEATSTASDSKRFAFWDSNLMTEFHARYGTGYGVMICWHVDQGRLCVYSQLESCSSSEVAAMIEGLLRHGPDAEIEANYTDTHGASLVGSAFTELLGFKLLQRLKNIGAIQLYAPGPDMAAWPKPEKILKKRPTDDPEQIYPYLWRTVPGPARLEDVIPGEPTFTWLPVSVRLPGRRRAVAPRCSCRSG